MEIYANASTTYVARLRAVTLGSAQGELMRTSTASGLRTVITVPSGAAIKGTVVSTIAPTAVKATASLPISDVVVFDGAAGIRSWSPPV
jgi:acyl-CoA hydrolase